MSAPVPPPAAAPPAAVASPQPPDISSPPATVPAMPAHAPDASTTTPATAGKVDNVQVFKPAESSSVAPEPDASFFEPTISDVQRYQAMIAGRSQQLNDAPLLTAKHREEEKAAAQKKKAEKWPNTTIRIKFSDGTQIQSTFPSSSPIQPVYGWVRLSLAPEAAEKPFTLYQPPRTTFPERPVPQPPSAAKKHPNPAMKARVITPANYGPQRGPNAAGLAGGTGGSETLSELGLVPQSVLLVRWEDAAMNSSEYPAPISAELCAKAAPLPPPVVKESNASTPSSSGPGKKLTGTAGEVKMPKWLQKGLMKKK